MFIQRDENQEIGYFGSNEKNQTIELGDQICFILEENSEIEIVAEVINITNNGYKVKIVEFESEDSSDEISVKINQALDISSEYIQYCYKQVA